MASSRSSCKDLSNDFTTRTCTRSSPRTSYHSKRISQNRHSSSEQPPRTFIEALLIQGIFKISWKDVRDLAKIYTRSSYKDLKKILVKKLKWAPHHNQSNPTRTHLPNPRMTTVSQNEPFEALKRSSKNMIEHVQVHLILRLPRKTTSWQASSDWTYYTLHPLPST